MYRLVIGIVLLVLGVAGTATTNTVFIGAIVVGIINIIRGAIQLGEQNRYQPPPM